MKASYPSRWLRGVGIAACVLLVVVGGYVLRRHCLIEAANDALDPVERVLTGVYLPWPVGEPESLFGRLTPEDYDRVRKNLGYEYRPVVTNGMTLVIHDSDGSYFVHFSAKRK